MTIALTIVTAAGAIYLTLALVRVVLFARRPIERADEFGPSFTILKAIAGLEPDLYENLASFCDQDYERYDVVFCLHDEADPALSVVRRVRADFPHVATRVAIGNNDAMRNPKIANLAKPGAEIQGEIAIVADSDVRVGRDYLRALASSFASERVGAATCLYGGIPNDSPASRLGALYIEDGFAPSVLVALALGKLRFCLGATMAVRKSVLEEIGGLEALGSQLADDHALGDMVAARGYDVDLSRYPVATTVPETTLRELWSHELRWARTNFFMAPAGYIFSFVMYALPFALANAIVTRTIWSLALFGLVGLLRMTLHSTSRAALGVRHRDDWWFLQRDSMTLAVWFASLFGRRVRWRNADVHVAHDGAMN